MTADEMETALAARGFDDYDAATLNARINAARAELDRMFLWPWREKSATGTAPLTVTDLGVIEAVTNETLDYPLRRVGNYKDLLEGYGDLSTAGDPIYYYVAWPNGVPVVATYPTNSNTIGVQYWKVTVDIDGTTEPASPDECHPLIVDLAAARGWRDKDNHDLANAIQADIDRQIAALLLQYQPGQQDGPDGYQSITGASDDW